MFEIIAIIIGYLLGSISPAYFFGRFLRGVDIREIGTKNAGATNVKRELGLAPAIITAIYDLSKGLISMLIAWKLGLTLPWIYGAGIAAAFGHIFPFYLRFRGGQGVATLVGILLYSLIILLSKNILPFDDLVIITFLVLTLLFITRSGELIGIAVLPALGYFIFQNYGFNTITIFTGIIIAYLWSLNIYLSHNQKLFELPKDKKDEIRVWRILARPGAIAFPIFYFQFGKSIALYIIGVILFVFLIFDLWRIFHQKFSIFISIKAWQLLKKGEERKFSSISLFLLACFLIVLLFPPHIAIASIVFLIFGDMFAKFLGMKYGKIRLFDKSLEGTIGYFTSSLVAGFFLMNYIIISPIVVISGAACAAFVEFLPLPFDDNFTCGLLSASAMLLVSNI